jgi:hypothetical protein
VGDPDNVDGGGGGGDCSFAGGGGGGVGESIQCSKKLTTRKVFENGRPDELLAQTSPRSHVFRSYY